MPVRGQNPTTPQVSCGAPVSHAHSWGRAGPGGCEPKCPGRSTLVPPSPGGYRPQLCCCAESNCPQDRRQPSIPEAAPFTPHASPEQSRRQGQQQLGEWSPQGCPLHNQGVRNNSRRDSNPTPTATTWDLTAPEGRSLGAGSMIMAFDQTRDLGQQRPLPPRGHAIVSPSCRRRKESRREGGIPLLVCPAVGLLPYLGWRGYFPPLPLRPAVTL